MNSRTLPFPRFAKHDPIKPNLPAKFPVALYHMLSSLSEIGDNRAISWAPHGRSIVIHDRDLFVKTYLGLFFKMKSMSSFVRQLNLYGFARIPPRYPDEGGYYHSDFLRGQEPLLEGVKRVTRKGTFVLRGIFLVVGVVYHECAGW